MVIRVPTMLISACVLLTTLAVSSGLTQADGPPFDRRRVPGLRPNLIANARVQVDEWPIEPASPTSVDEARFAAAYEELCGRMRPGRAEEVTGFILESAGEFGVDPFLVAALVHVRTIGSCRFRNPGEQGQLGVTGIRRETFAESFHDGLFRYYVRDSQGWTARMLRLDRYPFAGPRLRRTRENIYFAAGLLSAFKEQHESLDQAFEGTPHRHYVSHFVWGDRVRSARDENSILTHRRRLLTYYGSHARVQPISWRGLTLGSPLDGAPRVVSSGLGSARDGGARRHRGIDFESLPGEAVRAVADGRVTFAGVDLPGRQSNQQLRRHRYDDVSSSEMGRGGRFVCILHQAQPAVRSCYMHLQTVDLEHGDVVARGDRVGTVGRTGMQSSAAHLHFELRGEDELLDPREVLNGIAIGDPNARP